ncbi:hypothetical protein [Parvibaculum sp.]|uniref:hypothetical protein n=1 Tax=Parvibaculum sp. TaxID=2024848 RepID=UPI000C58FF87|nr:hypothetical protein [Parvibaculum sp.]MAM95704.1 hypothetical protein [Parvibaculum sp.]HCX68569.1 hypothetical protein [Rhodobiaceae bacterium]|tara:strand:- start:26647 stop:26895 length:249 start_codon:yes stop_codon:yes gene_type:complete
MNDPLFDIESRYHWRYADDCLHLADEANTTLEVHGDLAGRLADGLQMLETAGVYMQPVLSLLWHTAAAGSAGLIVPQHEGGV